MVVLLACVQCLSTAVEDICVQGVQSKAIGSYVAVFNASVLLGLLNPMQHSQGSPASEMAWLAGACCLLRCPLFLA